MSRLWLRSGPRRLLGTAAIWCKFVSKEEKRHNHFVPFDSSLDHHDRDLMMSLRCGFVRQRWLEY